MGKQPKYTDLKVILKLTFLFKKSKFDRGSSRERNDIQGGDSVKEEAGATRRSRGGKRGRKESRSRSPRLVLDYKSPPSVSRRRRTSRKRSPSPLSSIPSKPLRDSSIDPFDSVTIDNRVIRESSLDPFDIVATTTIPSTTIDFSTFILSTSDPSSMSSIHLQPIIEPPESDSRFQRQIKTEISFGYLSPFKASLAFSSFVAPLDFSDDEQLQVRYEEFLTSQIGGKEKKLHHYYRILEKLGEFSELNERFSEIASLITSGGEKK